MKHIKKFSLIAACAVLAASALGACDARDGKIDDNSRTAVISNDGRTTDTTSRRTVSRTTSSRAVNSTHSGEGVIHDTASMIGDVGEDIVEGAENIGSSVASNVNDAFDNTDEDNNMDNM